MCTMLISRRSRRGKGMLLLTGVRSVRHRLCRQCVAVAQESLANGDWAELERWGSCVQDLVPLPGMAPENVR